MKFVRHLVLLACILGVFSTSALAQAGMQTVDLGDEYQISVPASWQVDQVSDGTFTAQGDDLTLNIFTPTGIAAVSVALLDASDAVDALVTMSVPLAQVRVSPSDFGKLVAGERLAAVFNTAEGIDAARLLAALPLSDGTIGFLDFSGAAGALEAAQADIEAIITSFDATGAAPNVNASIGQACTVSVAAANSAALRVGPGTNRSSISFLPASTRVTVTGRNELDDGSIWYQLDKAQAAPGGSAAAELWVNAEDVEASGDCASVGDTSAPPVIPISVAPPPAATAAPGEPAPLQPEPAQSGALPAAGFWTLNLNPTTNASCLGYENVPYNTSEVYTSPFFTGPLNIVNSGAFDFNGDVFRRVGSSNSFTGTITFDVEGGGSMVTQVRFDLASSTRMTGQIVANYNADDGTPCSDTVAFAATLG